MPDDKAKMQKAIKRVANLSFGSGYFAAQYHAAILAEGKRAPVHEPEVLAAIFAQSIKFTK